MKERNQNMKFELLIYCFFFFLQTLSMESINGENEHATKMSPLAAETRGRDLREGPPITKELEIARRSPWTLPESYGSGDGGALLPDMLEEDALFDLLSLGNRGTVNARESRGSTEGAYIVNHHHKLSIGRNIFSSGNAKEKEKN
jgi:hypothetical protein